MTCCFAGVRLASQVSILQIWRRLRRGRWQKVCALGLSMTFAALFLLTSLCLATGFLHADASHDRHHSRTHPEADHPSALPDICDFVLQALLTTELRTVRFPVLVMPPGDAIASIPVLLPSRRPAAFHSSRAPPAVSS